MRKDDRLFINDGIYGIFWELRLKGHDRYPALAYRDGRPMSGPEKSFRLYGPTCDNIDVLPGAVGLPADIRAGDYIEFSGIGAYSLSGRSNFNGHFSDTIVTIAAD
jgi:ornithine decarboxylase